MMTEYSYLEFFMLEALKMAQKASNCNEVPVGAIIVKDGNIIGSGFNKVIKKNSSLFHAEMIAIYQASQALKNYRLVGTQIYSTLEPCHMCAKAIVDARIDHLFFGALEPKTGAIISIDQFLDRDNLNHKVHYSGGHLADRSSLLLKKFFQSKRIKKTQ
ncbi:tRNA adenosine(34) deaminase TadA [Gammaproteobacteria bacterium]|nr:tRNA adenosine(34) deaminase TadA [Gammaproteobacteria bacterium]MDC0914554.1 tRNA adenosine(34) deaminase TadA [Gammaproteobacteria bacterium]